MANSILCFWSTFGRVYLPQFYQKSGSGLFVLVVLIVFLGFFTLFA